MCSAVPAAAVVSCCCCHNDCITMTISMFCCGFSWRRCRRQAGSTVNHLVTNVLAKLELVDALRRCAHGACAPLFTAIRSLLQDNESRLLRCHRLRCQTLMPSSIWIVFHDVTVDSICAAPAGAVAAMAARLRDTPPSSRCSSSTSLSLSWWSRWQPPCVADVASGGRVEAQRRSRGSDGPNDQADCRLSSCFHLALRIAGKLDHVSLFLIADVPCTAAK